MAAVFEVDLKDKVSAEAKAAAQAVTTLERALTSTTNALTRANATGNIAQHNKLTASSQALTAALGQEKDKLASLTSGLGSASTESSALSGAMESVPWLAVAKGAATAAAAIAGATVALVALTVQAVTARAKMLATFGAFQTGAGAAAGTVAMLDTLSTQLGKTREELAPLATQFMAMGIRDLPTLQKALTASAAASALMGDEGASAFRELTSKVQGATQAGTKFKGGINDLATQLSHMGLSVTDVAAAMGISTTDLGKQLASTGVDAGKLGNALNDALAKKGKGALDVASGSVGFLASQLKANVMHMFEGVDAKPLLDALKQLVGLFSDTTASGKAMKGTVTGTMQAIVGAAAKALPYVIHGILQLIIVGLKVAIALKPVAKSAKEFYDAIGGGKTVLAAAKLALTPIVTAVALLGAGALLAAYSIGGMLKAGAKIVSWAKDGAKAAKGLTTGLASGITSGAGKVVGAMAKLGALPVTALVAFITGGPKAAKALITGLVSGITSGAGLVLSAIKGLGSSAISALKGVLGIHSPSRVMMALGGHTATGFAEGVEQATPRVAGASGAMAAAAAAGGAAAGGAAGGGRGSVSITVERGAIQIDGAGKSAMAITEEMIATVFERLTVAGGYG